VKTLALFRHAKSDWSDARARDFDRPLNARGQRGALAMGRYIRDTGRRFDRVIASPAVRVAETVEYASKAWGAVFRSSGTGGSIWPVRRCWSTSCAN
jgi:phosphohistidine phosphatase